MQAIRLSIGLWGLGLLLAAGTVRGQATPAVDPPLSGTTWQLQAIQSMDDAQGTTTVPHPDRFTVHFGADGRASFRLDCNRGTGAWHTDAAGPDAGSLTLGPIAATRALCPPPHLDERVARDMPHVRSYRLQDDQLFMSLMADGGIYAWQKVATAPSPAAAPQNAAARPAPDRTVTPVTFPPGAHSTVLKGRIQGNHYTDYQLRAGAGQRLTASFKGRNALSYFNVLPPGSDGAAMFVGSTSGDRFDGLLPDDGVYTLRVYLMRAGARRNETSDFTLSVGIAGQPLLPVSAKADAVLPGTPFHAATTVPCQPAYSQANECAALVTRRGFEGSATVELRWDQGGKRRVLFIHGEPKVWDTFQPMTPTRHERGWLIRSGDDEWFDIPEPLVYGG